MFESGPITLPALVLLMETKMAAKKRKRSAEVYEEPPEEEERYFLHPDSVSQHLYCSICQEVFSDPQRAPCGHSFCKKCILPWLQKNETCPEDRKPVKEKQLHRDFILENIIGDQMVACPFRSRGCSHVGQLELLTIHKRKCSFNPSNLPTFLKTESPMTGITNPPDLSSDDEESPVPDLGKPSLKMRLFCAGADQKRLLCAMFDEDDETPNT